MLNFIGETNIGARRSSNQDTFRCVTVATNATLGIVCDGMGGCNGGSIASSMASASFVSYLCLNSVPCIGEDDILEMSSDDITQLLHNACDAANQAVFEKAQQDENLAGMGTTLVAAYHVDDTVYVVNIGDSRLYLITDDDMVQITHDHSLVQYLMDIGELTPDEAATNPNKNVIIRAVGSEEQTDADIFLIDMKSVGHCCVLLCSDGLTNYASEEAIQALMSTDLTPQDKAKSLITLANDGGGGDNITVVIGTEQA